MKWAVSGKWVEESSTSEQLMGRILPGIINKDPEVKAGVRVYLKVDL